jgi:hypothetical protein
LLTDFKNVKIKSVQSFIVTHRDRVCARVFIEVSTRAYEYLHQCFKEKIISFSFLINCENLLGAKPSHCAHKIQIMFSSGGGPVVHSFLSAADSDLSIGTFDPMGEKMKEKEIGLLLCVLDMTSRTTGQMVTLSPKARYWRICTVLMYRTSVFACLSCRSPSVYFRRMRRHPSE